MNATPTANDYREAAKACREAYKGKGEAILASFLVDDLGLRDLPASWLNIAKLLDAKADSLDPPKPGVILYTTASHVYDGFSVRELDANAGTDNHGYVVRKVSVEPRDRLWFVTRCESGCHSCVTEDEAKRFGSIWRLNVIEGSNDSP